MTENMQQIFMYLDTAAYADSFLYHRKVLHVVL